MFKMEFGSGTYFIGDPIYVLNDVSKQRLLAQDARDGKYPGFCYINSEEKHKWVEDNDKEQYHIRDGFGIVHFDQMKHRSVDSGAISPLQLMQLGWLVKADKIIIQYLDDGIINFIVDDKLRTLNLYTISESDTQEVEDETIQIDKDLNNLPDLSADDIKIRKARLRPSILDRIKCLLHIK